MVLDRLITRIRGGLAVTTHQKGIPKVSKVFGHDGGWPKVSWLVEVDGSRNQQH